MSYALAPDQDRLSVDDYLAQEAVAEQKHEYVAGWVYAFAGASRRHNVVVSRILRLLLNAAGGSECTVFTSDMLVRAAADVFYYPDVTVVCDADDRHARYVERPCLVVEVLSTSTAQKDQREKLLLYRNIASLQGYLIVAPDEGWLELHERGDDGSWSQVRFTSQDPVSIPCVDGLLVANDLFIDLPGASE